MESMERTPRKSLGSPNKSLGAQTWDMGISASELGPLFSKVTGHFAIPGSSLALPYCHHHGQSLEDGGDFCAAVVVVHGTMRNPSDYFEQMHEALNIEFRGMYGDNILLLAPHFMSATDVPGQAIQEERRVVHVEGEAYSQILPSDGIDVKLPLNHADSMLLGGVLFRRGTEWWEEAEAHPEPLYWEGDAWKQGNLSTTGDDGDGGAGAAGDGERERLSSFAVLDALVDALADKCKFPHLEVVIVIGHSAGGQVIQRWAMGNRVDGKAGYPRVRYVVSNPSSYTYLDASRPVNTLPYDVDTNKPLDYVVRAKAHRYEFAVPPSLDAVVAGEYNTWKYGLDALNNYMRTAGTNEEIGARFAGRDVVYLLGTSDVRNKALDPLRQDDMLLDKSAAAMLQGTNRLERGLAYFQHVKRTHPNAAHSIVFVERVGHDAAALFKSEPGSGTISSALKCARGVLEGVRFGPTVLPGDPPTHGRTRVIPICRNPDAPLDSRRTAQFAVITLHGYFRCAELYYKWMAMSVRMHYTAGFSCTNVSGFSRQLIDNVVVTTPHFTPPGHAAATQFADCALWDDNWKAMSPELVGEGEVPMTPMDAIDALVMMFAVRQRFPQMRRIVLIGNSAGAQFCQRYAIANRIDQPGIGPCGPGGVQMRYLVVAPSSYVYLSDERPLNLPPRLRANYEDFATLLARKYTFGTPAKVASTYNRWKYGLDGMPAALCTAPTREALIERYLRRDVYYCIGQDDIRNVEWSDTPDEYDCHLDTSSSAYVQGNCRLERAIAYMQHVRGLYETCRHSIVFVPGVHHEARKMFADPQVQSLMFL